MMMIKKTDASQVSGIRDFFREELVQSPLFEECIFYVAYEDDEVIGAAGVRPSEDGADILSIGVGSPRLKRGIGSALINYMSRDLGRIYSSYEKAWPRLKFGECLPVWKWEELDPFLVKNGFVLQGMTPLFSVTLEQILSNETIVGGRAEADIRPLKDVQPALIRTFGNRLIREELYPGIDMNELDGDFSMVYISGDEIKGCMLNSRIKEGEYMNEWVYLEKSVKDRMLILDIFAACARKAGEMLDPGTKVWFLPVGSAGGNLLRRLLPEARAASEVREYEKALTNVNGYTL